VSTTGSPWGALRAELLEVGLEDLNSFGFRGSPPDEEAQVALQRPWSFLSDAGSCVAFEDPAAEYILKLFKSPRGVIRKFQEWGANMGESSWTPYPGDEVRSAEFKVRKTLYSAAFASQYFAKETGTLHAQLLPTSGFEPQLTIEGELVEMANMSFVLQRRCETLESRLSHSVNTGNFEQGCRVLEDFLMFVDGCWRRGVTDSPFNFSQNYGYLRDHRGERLVQFSLVLQRWTPSDLTHSTINCLQRQGVCGVKDQSREP
jgi:hypothetical protein